MEKNVTVISFDGLNRSGKGTQTKLLSSYLNLKGYPSVILRGDGSRKGNGAFGDPVSRRWQELQIFLKNSNLGEEINDHYWENASRMLNEELYNMYHNLLPNFLEKNKKEKGFIILDRSLISRLFVKKRKNPEIVLEDLLTFYDSNDIQKDVILPDISFLLSVPQKILLERNEIISDQTDKYSFRKKIISDYYNDFSALIDKLNTNLFKTYFLNGVLSKNNLFDEIKSCLFYEKIIKLKEVKSYV